MTKATLQKWVSCWTSLADQNLGIAKKLLGQYSFMEVTILNSIFVGVLAISKSSLWHGNLTLLLYHESEETLSRTRAISSFVFESDWCGGQSVWHYHPYSFLAPLMTPFRGKWNLSLTSPPTLRPPVPTHTHLSARGINGLVHICTGIPVRQVCGNPLYILKINILFWSCNLFLNARHSLVVCLLVTHYITDKYHLCTPHGFIHCTRGKYFGLTLCCKPASSVSMIMIYI